MVAEVVVPAKAWVDRGTVGNAGAVTRPGMVTHTISYLYLFHSHHRPLIKPSEATFILFYLHVIPEAT